MKRRVLRWGLAIAILLMLAAGFAWRVATSVDVIDGRPLSNGQYNVRFLKAGLGQLSYSSDDKVREFLRPRLPGFLVKKLGDVTAVGPIGAGKPEFGDLPLALLFQLLTPQNAVQGNTTNVFVKIEFPESTGFVFVDEIGGYSSNGQGTSFHTVAAFPRRDPTLSFRLYETGRKDTPFMEKSFANPAYRSDFPVWTPEPLPSTKSVDNLRVTLRSLKIESTWHDVIPVFEVESDDASWLKPTHSRVWTDATGNSGQWLSPFETAWKLHLRLRRRRDAEFPATATWKVPSLAVPVGLTLTEVEQTRVVDGIGLKLQYVAPAGKIRDENGKITIAPPTSPGQPGMNMSSGSTGSGARMVTYTEIDTGMPFIRVDHDPLPPGVELICDVRDENGVLRNGDRLFPRRQGLNGVNFYAVPYESQPETRTLTLETRVSRPKDVEFVIAPPAEMREAVKANAAR